MKQDPAAGITLDPDSYVYLTTSVGSPETANAGGAAGQQSGVTTQRNTSSAAASSLGVTDAAQQPEPVGLSRIR